MPSDFFTSVIERELEIIGEASANSKPTPYNYTVVLGSNREEKTGTAIRFQFKKDIDLSDNAADSITSSVLSILDTDDLGMIDAILDSMKLSEAKLINNRNRNGSGYFKLGEAEERIDGLKAGIQMANGRFESATKLRSILKLLTIRYVTEEMSRPGTDGLVFRTGRLATSVDLFPIAINKADPTKLSLYYTYMLYPYATFDPLVSSQPWLLKGGARNPQKLIGEALLKAARSIIHSRYKLDVKQGR